MMISRREIILMPALGVLGACSMATTGESILGISSIINIGSEVAKIFRGKAPDVATDALTDVGVHFGIEYADSLFDKTEKLRKLAIKSGLDARLVLEAATVVGPDEMIGYVKDNVRMWYQFKHGPEPINEFSYDVYNPTDSVLGGQIKFNFSDDKNGVVGDPIWTDPFDIAPGSRVKNTVQLFPADLNFSGEKTINVVTQPAGVTLSVPKVVILPMSPS